MQSSIASALWESSVLDSAYDHDLAKPADVDDDAETLRDHFFPLDTKRRAFATFAPTRLRNLTAEIENSFDEELFLLGISAALLLVVTTLFLEHPPTLAKPPLLCSETEASGLS